jgi:NAD-dependent dihydropyrimidine dehydrogenase PreA subunit
MPRGHIKTAYLDIDKAKCTACGSCVEACPFQVLKVVGIKFLINHRHIHVVKPKECSGCLLCVEACPERAIKENGQES